MKWVGIFKTRFLLKIKNFKPREILVPKKSMYKQTAGNCWIYAVLNNLYLNTWIKVDHNEVKDYIRSFDINTDTGNDYDISASLLCWFLEKQDKTLQLRACKINVMEQPQLFAQLLLKWYSFVYTRDCHNNVLQDILEDNEIDDAIITRWSRHAVNLCYLKKKLTEYGSRWDTSVYNNFCYHSIGVFYKSIRAGAITPTVIFLDYVQKKNG